MQENQNIEWKESWRDEYLKWICGFANAQGGRIFIGKNDQGIVNGLKDCKKLLEDIPNKVRDVLGLIVDVNQHTENGLNYLEIVVEPNPYPISYYGEYYYRTGSTKQQLKGQALNHFLLRKTGITWDSVPVPNTSVKQLRNDGIDIFREHALLSKRLDEKTLEADNEQLLDSLNLLENGLLKRAGILLFHHNPEKWIPGAYIKIGFFVSDSEILYQDEIHGSLISQANQVVDLIYTKYLKGLIGYKGVVRSETYPFPREAIREAVFNAIAHKFYGALIPIQIRVYTDKIFIANDCFFPEDWTEADLWEKHRSRPYNPLIANTFFRAGFIEAWGRGIEKISESCMASNTPLPKIVIKSDEMSLTFTASPEYLKLKKLESSVETSNSSVESSVEVADSSVKSSVETSNSPVESSVEIEDSSVKICRMMAQNPQITMEELARQLNITKRAVEKQVKQLREQGRIVRIGPKKGGHWEVSQI